MSDEQKKTGVSPWIVALLIGLPVTYVASFGLACWLACRTGASLPTFYVPVGWAGMNGPKRLRTTICPYAHCGLPKGSIAFLPVDLSGNTTSLSPKR
jgi:hypothetical protein